MRTPIFLIVGLVVGRGWCSPRGAIGNDYYLLRRLHGAAIHRAGDRLEHPRRLLRLREFRLGGLLRARRLFDGRSIYKLYHRCRSAAAVLDADRRRGVRHRRLRHGLSDAAAARRVLRHRDAGACRGAADAGGQLGLRRRLARRLYHAARDIRAVRQLHQISVPDHAGACGRSRSRSRG